MLNCIESVLAKRLTFPSVSHLGLHNSCVCVCVCVCVFRAIDLECRPRCHSPSQKFPSRVPGKIWNIWRPLPLFYFLLVLQVPGLKCSTRTGSARSAHSPPVRWPANLVSAPTELPSFILTLHWGAMYKSSSSFLTFQNLASCGPGAHLLLLIWH